MAHVPPRVVVETELESKNGVVELELEIRWPAQGKKAQGVARRSTAISGKTARQGGTNRRAGRRSSPR